MCTILVEASSIKVVDLPEPEIAESSTLGVAESAETPATSNGHAALTSPTFREIPAGETMTKGQAKLKRKQFGAWFLDNLG